MKVFILNKKILFFHLLNSIEQFLISLLLRKTLYFLTQGISILTDSENHRHLSMLK